MSNVFSFDAERLKQLAEIDRRDWLHIPSANDAVAELLDVCASGRRHDPECVLLTGPPGVGKSMVLKRVERLVNKIFEGQVPKDCNANKAFLRFELAPAPTPNGLARDLLHGGNFPVTASVMSVVQVRALEFIDDMGVQALGCDEFNRVGQTSPRVRAATLDAAKMISNVSGAPLVLAGTPESQTILASDPQLRSRCAVIHLSPWEYGEPFRRFLRTLESTLRLPEPSDLGRDEIANLIFGSSKGITREVCRIVRGSAKRALRQGQSNITKDHIIALLGSSPLAGRGAA